MPGQARQVADAAAVGGLQHGLDEVGAAAVVAAIAKKRLLLGVGQGPAKKGVELDGFGGVGRPARHLDELGSVELALPPQGAGQPGLAMAAAHQPAFHGQENLQYIQLCGQRLRSQGFAPGFESRPSHLH